MPKDEVLIAMERKRYHERLLQTGTLAINANGVATNADKDSVISVMIAKGIAEQLMAETNERVAGQTAGASFEMLTMEFVKRNFSHSCNILDRAIGKSLNLEIEAGRKHQHSLNMNIWRI